MHQRWYPFFPWAASPSADANWGWLNNPLIANTANTETFGIRILRTPPVFPMTVIVASSAGGVNPAMRPNPPCNLRRRGRTGLMEVKRPMGWIAGHARSPAMAAHDRVRANSFDSGKSEFIACLQAA
jgi:hypothetical protein